MSFIFEKQTLINLSEQARFPFLCANLVDENDKLPDYIKPYVILERHGYKIGVIGVGAQSIIKDNFKQRLLGLKLLPIKETIDKYTKELKDKNVDYIIVSGDLNYRFPVDDINKKRKDEKDENEEISNAVSNKMVNAFLFKTREDILDKDNLINKCNGIVTVKDNDGNNKTVFIAPEKGYGVSDCYLEREMNTFKHSLLTINSEQLKPDVNIAEALYQINKNLAEQGGIILGFAEEEITIDNSKESMIGNLVTDALRVYCKTDIALINSGAITSDIKKGPITKLNVYNVYPYEDILHVVSLTGTQLLKILEMSCNYDPYYPKKFLQLSGINFWYNSCEPPGFRIYLKTVKVNNIPLDINATYTVVLPQFLLEGRTGFDEILDMKISTDRVVPVSTRYIIEDYIQKEHDIKIGIEKRSFDVHPECRGDK